MTTSALWKIKLDGITARELIDTGSYFDAQDPSVKITCGKHVFQTKRMKDAGCNAVFTEEFELSIKEEEYETLHVSVKERSNITF